MPKINYANLVEGIGRGIGHIAKAHAQGSAREILESPNATPIQKALAWETFSEGSGAKAYETILKEKALKQQEENDNVIKQELNGRQPMNLNIGANNTQNAPGIEAMQSPVGMANNLTQEQQMGPEEAQYGQQLPQEAMTPAFQAMMEARGSQVANEPQQNAAPGQHKTINDIPTERLQQLLGSTENKPVIRQIQAELDRRKTNEKNEARRDAARISTQADVEKENRAEIRKYAEPYQNVQKFEQGVKELEEAQDIILNSGAFSFDETKLRTLLTGIAEGRGQDSLAEIAKTPEQHKVYSAILKHIKPKEIGGSNPSTKEVLLTLASQASPYKGKAANVFIMENVVNFAKLEAEKARAILDTRADFPNITAPEFYKKVNNRVATYGKEIEKESQQRVNYANAQEIVKARPPKPGFNVMMDKETGKLKEVPANQVPLLQAQEKILIK